jgi:hypothetical protein
MNDPTSLIERIIGPTKEVVSLVKKKKKTKKQKDEEEEEEAK